MSALTSQVITVGINFAAATATPVAAPTNGQQILLRGLCLIVNAATVITFNSQMSGFGFGPFNFAAATTNPLILPDLMPTEEADPFYTGWAANTALVIANSNSVQVSGYLRYSLV
jgi:hypothetical protein